MNGNGNGITIKIIGGILLAVLVGIGAWNLQSTIDNREAIIELRGDIRGLTKELERLKP